MPEYASFLPSQRLQLVLSLSADGSMVAYVSDASGQFNIWVRHIADGTARQLTFFTERSVRQVAWAPDGDRLALTADAHGDEKTQVYLISADGGGLTRISEADDRAAFAYFGEGCCTTRATRHRSTLWTATRRSVTTYGTFICAP